MRTLFFVLMFCLIPVIASAEPLEGGPLIPVPAGPDVITAMKKGDVATHDGQLFDQATAIRWANFLQQANTRLKLDPLYQYKVDQVEVDALKKTIEIEQERYRAVSAELQVRLTEAQKEAANPPFYKTFGFGMGVGVAATVLVVVGAAVLVNSVK